MTMRNTYIKRKKELMNLIEKMQEICGKIKGYEDLIIAERVVEMFKEDAEKIKRDYLNNIISKREAEENLNELKNSAEALHWHTREIRDNIEKILREVRYSTERFVERSIIGIDIREVVAEIIGFIENISLPKKEFGILEVKDENLSKIPHFIEEHESGLIICKMKLSEAVEKIITQEKVTFEAKELGQNKIFILGART